MSVVILRIAAVLYAGATAAYIVHFARPRHTRLATAGAALLGAAFLVHAIAIGVGCSEFGGAEFFSLRGGLVLMVWLAAGAYLLLLRFYHLPTLGAFITPFILVVLIPALFGSPGHPELPPDALRHPSLDALDRMVQRLVRAGFVVYTVALVARTITATAVWKSAWSWDPQQIVSMTVWLLYGVLVQLRHSGWHGRRYALLTLAGFVLVLGSMVTLKVVPGITRHTGDYGTVAIPDAGGAQ